MTDQDKQAPSLSANWQGMREDRPLDALFPELQGYTPPAEKAPAKGPDIWPHVMEISLESTWQWAMASWSTPENSAVFLKTLKRMIRRTVVQEWSKPPSFGDATGRVFEGIILFCFEPLDDASAAAMPSLGFERLYGYEPDHYRERLSVLGEQANEQGWAMPVQPAQLWWSPIHQPDAAMAEIFQKVHTQLVQAQGARVWGQRPGEPSKLMAEYMKQGIQIDVRPTLDALHELDMLIVERVPGRLRWMSPMLVQGLCDLIGIVAVASLGKNVQWGLCEPDKYGGYYEPSLRLVTPKGPKDIEIGLALYDVIAAPVEDPATIPFLREWVPALFQS